MSRYATVNRPIHVASCHIHIQRADGGGQCEDYVTKLRPLNLPYRLYYDGTPICVYSWHDVAQLER